MDVGEEDKTAQVRPLTAQRRRASVQGLCGCLEARTDAQGPRSATGRLRDCRRFDVARRSGSCRQPRRRSRTTLSAPTVLALLRKLWRRRACAERRRWLEQSVPERAGEEAPGSGVRPSLYTRRTKTLMAHFPSLRNKKYCTENNVE